MQSIKNLEYQQCRTCYDSTSNLQKLTSFAESSPIGTDKTYAQLLLEVCNIDILNDKPLGRWPQFICLNCSRKLKIASEFIQHSLKINQLLQSIADLLQMRRESNFIETTALDIPLEIKLEKEDDLDCFSSGQKFEYSPIEIDGQTVDSGLQTNEFGNISCINNTPKINKNKINCNENENIEETVLITVGFVSEDVVNKDNLDKFHRVITNNMKNEEQNDNSVLVCADESLLTVAETKNSKTNVFCKLCKKPFSSASKLTQHKSFCTRLKTHCEMCDQHFSNPSNYRRHMKNLHKNKTIKKQTPNKLPKNRQMIKHLNYIEKNKTSNNNQKTTCNLCNKKFNNTNRLIRHQRYTHISEEEKISCKFCSRKFARPDNYQTHFKRMHTTNVDCSPRTSNDIQSPRYSCSKCDSSFSRSTLLLKHELDVHSELKRTKH